MVSLTESIKTEDCPAQDEYGISLSQFIFDMVKTLLTAVLSLLLIMAFFCRQVTVDGPSMNDTLHHEDRLLVSCFQYTPHCGDIVIVTHGRYIEDPIVKRVIAVAGQRIDIDNATGQVIVDEVLLKEDYISGTTHRLSNSVTLPMTVPEGYVFVMGDNREHSLDSRSTTVDLIPVENIIGKATFRWYPLNSFGGL